MKFTVHEGIKIQIFLLFLSSVGFVKFYILFLLFAVVLFS